jgi:diguanylate cyclase (GGDEF)-like protein
MGVKEGRAWRGVDRRKDDRATTLSVSQIPKTTLPGRRAAPRDALLGAGLVGALPIVVGCTFWLTSSVGSIPSTLAIEFGATLLALTLLLLPWSRLPASLLLIFPGIVAATLVASAGVDRTVSASYVGFITVSFLYIGLTQARWVPLLAVPIAIPVYLFCALHVTPALEVRLPIAGAIWLLVGEVVADRSARSRHQTELLGAQANNDGLTGLTSRLGLFREVHRALGELDDLDGSTFLFLLDIDGFKIVNDTFGHPVGDEILVAFAERIRRAIRSIDLAARLGGDEFAVVIKGANAAIAGSLGKRLVEAAAEPFDLSAGRIVLTASEGIVQLTESMSAPDVIRNADVAMYEAKSNGKNRLAFFELELQEQIANRARLSTELYNGIEEEEFVLHWQPTVHIGTGETVGVEALVRWHHPERGMLLPAEFIHVAEDTRLIVPLGNWVLDQACRQGSALQPVDLGRQLTISVNVSPHQLLDGQLCQYVRNALAASELPAEALVLEITERTLMVNSPLIRKQLDDLKQLGVRLAIDDFGTGYSSLAYLRSFPIDIVKIDQSFVDSLDKDEQSVALVRSIISIAEALGLDTVAEGVETAAQLQILRRLGCQVAQGHLFSRAVPMEVLTSHLDPTKVLLPFE